MTYILTVTNECSISYKQAQQKSLSSGIDSAFLLPAYLKRIEAVIVSVPPKLLFVSAYILTQ